MVTGRFFFSSRNTSNINELTAIKQPLGESHKVHGCTEKSLTAQFITFSMDWNFGNFGLAELYYY